MSLNWCRFISIIVMIAMLWCIHLTEMPIRGFWCDDHTIRYPHIPAIIDYRVLLAVCILFPILIFRVLPSPKRSENANDNENDKKNRLAYTAPDSSELDYVFGFILNLVLTTYCKVVIARPRPNFYEICKPTVGCEAFETRFISDFSCTTTNHQARNSIQSFFSGHSSIGTYSALFSALHVAAHWPVDYMVKSLACSVLIGLGLFPGFSQYLNHWHHWSDVLVGQLVGLVLAAAAFHMRYWFRRNGTINNFKSKVESQ